MFSASVQFRDSEMAQDRHRPETGRSSRKTVTPCVRVTAAGPGRWSVVVGGRRRRRRRLDRRKRWRCRSGGRPHVIIIISPQYPQAAATTTGGCDVAKLGVERRRRRRRCQVRPSVAVADLARAGLSSLGRHANATAAPSERGSRPTLCHCHCTPLAAAAAAVAISNMAARVIRLQARRDFCGRRRRPTRSYIVVTVVKRLHERFDEKKKNNTDKCERYTFVTVEVRGEGDILVHLLVAGRHVRGHRQERLDNAERTSTI